MGSMSKSFYCSSPHSSSPRGPMLLGNLPAGSSAILICPDALCQRRYHCVVDRVPDADGELVTTQRYIGRGRRLTSRPNVVG